MTQAPAAVFKIPTKSPQPPRGKALAAPARRPPRSRMQPAGSAVASRPAPPPAATGKSSSWSYGITVYPPRQEGGRWRAVWHEDGERQQCESVSRGQARREAGEGQAAARGGRVEHDQARRGPDRLVPQPRPAPGGQNGGRASTRTPSGGCASGSPPRLSARSPARTSRPATRRRSSTPPPPRARATGSTGCCPPWSARASRAATWSTRCWPRSTGRPGTARCPPRRSRGGRVGAAGSIPPRSRPASTSPASGGRWPPGRSGERDELMANLAAYSGLRWGELAALTIAQVDEAARVITVDRKVVEVGGQLYVEAPKNRKFRRTIYPRRTPAGYPLAERLAARDRGGTRRAGGRHQPARADLPVAAGKLLAVLELQPAHPPARLPGGRVARQLRARAGGPGTACGTCSAPRRCSPGSSTPPTCRGWPGTPTTASRSTCTSAPPPASSTAPARPPSNRPGPTREPGPRAAGRPAPPSSRGPTSMLALNRANRSRRARWISASARCDQHGGHCDPRVHGGPDHDVMREISADLA